SEARYRSLFEDAMEGVFSSTLEGRFTNANPALARLLGYESPRELMESVTDIGRQLYVDPADRDRYVAALRGDGHVAAFEVGLRRKDGSTAWVRSDARLVRGPDGEPSHIEGMCADMTDRHH